MNVVEREASLRAAADDARAQVAAAVVARDEVTGRAQAALRAGDVAGHDALADAVARAVAAVAAAEARFASIQAAHVEASGLAQRERWEAQLGAARDLLASDAALLGDEVEALRVAAAEFAARVRHLWTIQDQVNEDHARVVELERELTGEVRRPPTEGRADSLAGQVPWLLTVASWAPSV